MKTFAQILVLISAAFQTSCGGGLPAPGQPATSSTSTQATVSFVVGLANGKFGANQVFDCQRNPAYPTSGSAFTASGFDMPYDSNGSHYTIQANQYIGLVLEGGNRVENGQTGCNVGFNLYNADGSINQQLFVNGTVWGINPAGFLYIASAGEGAYGTFFSNNTGASFGGSTTYTPAAGIASCDDLLNYSVSSAPLGAGESIL